MTDATTNSRNANSLNPQARQQAGGRPVRAGRRLRADLQDYYSRGCVYHLLDYKVFEALNGMDRDGACAVLMATTGCLDALDRSPGGSMRAVDVDGQRGLYDQTHTERDRTLLERDGLERETAALVAAVLGEDPQSADHDEFADIVACVALGNNGWVFRFTLTAQQRDQADAAVRAERLCRVWKPLFGHPMQLAYVLPEVLQCEGKRHG